MDTTTNRATSKTGKSARKSFAKTKTGKSDSPDDISITKSDILVETENPSNEESCGRKCSLCGRELAGDVALTLHILCTHVPVDCEICGVSLSSLSQANYHKDLIHKESRYNCPKCSKKFLQAAALDGHLQICGNKKISCNFCSGRFKSLYSLRDHQTRRCRAAMQAQQNDGKGENQGDEQSSTSPHDRNTEGHDSKDSAKARLQALQAHFGSDFSTTECRYCEKKVTDVKTLYNHMRTNHQEYTCEVCGTISAGLTKHRAHKFACHKKAQFHCLMCGMEFRYKGRYEEHFSTCKLKKRSCEICGQLFRFASGLEVHMKAKHSGDGFSENVHTDEAETEPHSTEMEIHDDEGQSVANPSILEQNSDDDEVGQANEQSSLQGGTDDESGALPDDNLIGSGRTKPEKISHWCPICGMGFPNYRKAYYHKWTRHTESQHRCSICAKEFPCKSALEVHASVCASRKHSCDVCGRKFRNDLGVMRHKKRHHSNIGHASSTDDVEVMEYTEEPDCAEEEKLDELVPDFSGETAAIHDCSEQQATISGAAEKISPIHGEDSSSIPFVVIHDVKKTDGENIGFNMKFKEEDTAQQEQLCQIPRSDIGKSTIAAPVNQKTENVLHRKLCVVQLVFRCTICNWDYMNKEALWNHLNLHEIVEESKELHYQEVKANHELHQCNLCNDQRAYSESSYRDHVRNVHEGFLIRCPDCGETFKSEQLKNEQTFCRCEAKKREVYMDQSLRNTFPVKSELMSYDSVPDMDSTMNVYSHDSFNATKNVNCDMIPVVETAEKDTQPSACDICGISFPSNHAAYYHKKTKHGQVHKCPHCRRIFLIEDYQAHLAVCEENRISCKLCDVTFLLPRNLTRHMKRIHHVGRRVKKQPDNKPVATSFECDICGQTFPTYYNFHYHKRKEHGRNHKCPHCRSLFEMEEYQKHVATCEKKTRVSCKICHLKYGNAIYLARHMKRIHCPKQTAKSKDDGDQIQEEQNTLGESVEADPKMTENSENDTTIKQTMENDSPSSKVSKVKCPHCDKEYVEGRPFLNHMYSTHRPFECNICGVTIPGAEKARYHKIMKHTEPTFECGKCLKKFYWKKEFHLHSSTCDPTTKRSKKQKPLRQPEQIDLRMEIKVEEAILEPKDDHGNSSANTFTGMNGDDPMNDPLSANTSELNIKKEHPEDDDLNYTSEQASEHTGANGTSYVPD